MNPASIDVKDMIVADVGLGLVFASTLFVGKEPATPNNTTTIFDTPGRPPQLTFTKGEDYYYDSVQVRIRHKEYLAGYALANKIMVSLHGRANETWNGILYTVVYCSNGPAMLGWDDNGRVIFIINFEIQRR